MEDRLIVLYDAECVLCSRLVRFIIDRDPDGRIGFASLSSGEVAEALENCVPCETKTGTGMPDSLIVIDGGRIYTYSSAALRIARRLPKWRAAYVLVAVPKSLRDAVYRFVARNRYRWFGKYDACPVPDARLRSRLLQDQEAAGHIVRVCGP